MESVSELDVGYSGGLSFMLDVCVPAPASCQERPVRAGLVSSGSPECRQSRGRGAERQRTTPLERRADRGSDSTFQMADTARRILARGSTPPPVCETADCFLFLSRLSSLLILLPQPLPSNSKQKEERKQLTTHTHTCELPD